LIGWFISLRIGEKLYGLEWQCEWNGQHRRACRYRRAGYGLILSVSVIFLALCAAVQSYRNDDQRAYRQAPSHPENAPTSTYGHFGTSSRIPSF
jgi:hypothetical protein